ncbi:MAG: porin family protein [Rhizobiaceae bacterium]|nr:porin family protein [Rhizobiaceae bacterium]
MFLSKRIALALAAAALLPAAYANAADYDPPVYVEPAEEYVPVEVGSGWYLRGDIGYVADKQYRDRQRVLADPDLAAFSPFNVTSSSLKDTPVFGSVGFGYHLNDFLRADLNLGMLAGDRYNMSGVVDDGCAGTQTVQTTNFNAQGQQVGPVVTTTGAANRDCAASLSARNTYWTGLANGYIDLGTYAGFTPYIGGGLGVVYSKVSLNGNAVCSADTATQGTATSSTTTTFLCQGQTQATDADVNYAGISYSDRKYSLLYAANAGVSYQVAKNTSIDVGYQYLNSPEARWVKLTNNGPEFGKGIDYHSVKVGLRYDLW